ncbi:MAG: AraC family transcriptional regulator [Bacillota bacterium]
MTEAPRPANWDYRISPLLLDKGIACAKSRDPKGKSRAAHCHEGFEIVFCERGKGTYHVGDHVFPLSPGAMMIFKAEMPHYMWVPNLFERWKLCLPEKGMLTEALLAQLEMPLLPWHSEIPGETRLHIKRILNTIQSEINVRQQNSSLLIRLMLEQMAILAQREQLAYTSVPQAAGTLLKITEYIDQHLTVALSVEDLSGYFGYTRGHVWRLFSEKLGVSPVQYINRRRIQESKNLLLTTDHSISTIAQMVGFSHPSYFIRLFRRDTGVTPRDYRRRHS